MKYDIVIIGAGPAGLSAAVYARRAGLTVAVLEQNIYGGQIVNTPEVENYPGVGRQTGVELAMALYNQAAETGADIILEGVTEVHLGQDPKVVVTAGGEYEAGAVIIANGAKRRLLGCPGEDTFSGRGVSYCATCDGAFFRGKTVAVIGGGDTALEDALFLSKTCEKVYLVHRRAEFRGVKVLSDRVYQAENIELILEAVPKEIRGEQLVNSLVVSQKGEEKELFVNGVFVAIGTKPESGLLSPLLDSDDNGIRTDEQTLMTNTRGIFAAGDVRKKPLRQILTAAADGAQAVFSVQKYLLEEEN